MSHDGAPKHVLHMYEHLAAHKQDLEEILEVVKECRLVDDFFFPA